MSLFGQCQRREKLGDTLHAAQRLELFHLLDETVHALGYRGDHAQRNIGTLTDATGNMIGRDTGDHRAALTASAVAKYRLPVNATASAKLWPFVIISITASVPAGVVR